VEFQEMVNYPHEVIREGYENQKVKSFDISERIMVFQLDNGELWWCGKSVAYKPERVKF
jgi:hypothetical protein